MILEQFALAQIFKPEMSTAGQNNHLKSCPVAEDKHDTYFSFLSYEANIEL